MALFANNTRVRHENDEVVPRVEANNTLQEYDGCYIMRNVKVLSSLKERTHILLVY